MKISIYGDIAKQDPPDHWEGCQIDVTLNDYMVELSIDRADGKKIRLSVDHEMLKYVIEVLQNSPNFEGNLEESSPD